MPDAELRILVVDDHEDNRALLQLMLSGRGMTYLGAEDGLVGLELARRERPDLILLDLEMPRMDGFACLAALKGDTRLRHIPVIILTAARLDPASIERGLGMGADEYLMKPIHTEELVVRIRSVVRVRKAERELAQLRRDFSSMLVHDLRSPLEGVAIALNLLLQDDLEPQDATQLVRMARDQVLELSTLIEDLMELRRAEAGLHLASSPVELGPVLDEVVCENELIARDKGLRLLLELPCPAPIIPGDRRVLKRVFTNLVSNALKFTPRGQVQIRVHPAREAVRIEVQDTGPGVEPGDAGRIFDKYFHIQRRRDRPEHGFGLGLAFCKTAVDEHGGRIGLASEPGRGATFWVELPLARVSP